MEEILRNFRGNANDILDKVESNLKKASMKFLEILCENFKVFE